MEEEYFRRKISWFSFFFSLLVIWVHSYNGELYLGKAGGADAVYRLEALLGAGAGQIAVPGFFMVSGYLFYRDFTWQKLGGKWQRRIHSVLVPYIVWNFLYYMGYVVASRLPWIRDVVGKGVVPFTLSDMVDAVAHYTYNYVFWYLHQLILLILMAPFLYFVLKSLWGRGLFLAFLWWAVAAKAPLPFVNADALIYYSSAACLAIDARKNQEKGQVEAGFKPKGVGPMICRRPLLWGLCLMALSPLLYHAGLRTAFIPCFVLCRLAAVAGLWLAVPGNCLPPEKDFMKGNFFLYGAHFALVRFINKAGAKVLPPVPAVPVALYLAMPFLVVAAVTVLGKALRRHAPVLWNLLSGWR